MRTLCQQWHKANGVNSVEPKQESKLSEPQIGDRVVGTQIGKIGGHYTYAACPKCGKTRWTQNPGRRCFACASTTKSAWKRLPDREFRPGPHGHTKYKDNCPECGDELWRLRDYVGHLCKKCSDKHAGLKRSGSKNYNWNGGRAVNRYGYVEVVIRKDSPYFSMARKHKNTVLEHRLVVAKTLGRCLLEWEVVHHKGVHYPENSPENKQDNSPENLELVIQAKNAAYARMTAAVSKLESRIEDLEKQNRLLKWQISNLLHGNTEPILPNEQEPSRQAGVETRSEESSTNKLQQCPAPLVGDDIVQSD